MYHTAHLTRLAEPFPRHDGDKILALQQHGIITFQINSKYFKLSSVSPRVSPGYQFPLFFFVEIGIKVLHTLSNRSKNFSFTTVQHSISASRALHRGPQLIVFICC